jgi:hypothetical protein
VATTGASAKIGAFALGSVLSGALTPMLGASGMLLLAAAGQVLAAGAGWAVGLGDSAGGSDHHQRWPAP